MQGNVGRIALGLQKADLTARGTQCAYSGTDYSGAINAERLIEASMSFVLALHVNLIAIQFAAAKFDWAHSLSVGVAALTAFVLVVAMMEKLALEAKARQQYPVGTLISRVVANAVFLTILPAFLPGLVTAYLWCNRR